MQIYFCIPTQIIKGRGYTTDAQQISKCATKFWLCKFPGNIVYLSKSWHKWSIKPALFSFTKFSSNRAVSIFRIHSITAINPYFYIYLHKNVHILLEWPFWFICHPLWPLIGSKLCSILFYSITHKLLFKPQPWVCIIYCISGYVHDVDLRICVYAKFSAHKAMWTYKQCMPENSSPRI